jgi:hypothetical protein
MKRRDLLNSLTMLAGDSLCSGSAWSQPTTPFKEKSQGKLAVPVRTFVRKNGALLRPIGSRSTITDQAARRHLGSR